MPRCTGNTHASAPQATTKKGRPEILQHSQHGPHTTRKGTNGHVTLYIMYINEISLGPSPCPHLRLNLITFTMSSIYFSFPLHCTAQSYAVPKPTHYILRQLSILWHWQRPHWHKNFLIFCFFNTFLLSHTRAGLFEFEWDIHLSAIIYWVLNTLRIIQDVHPTKPNVLSSTSLWG